MVTKDCPFCEEGIAWEIETWDYPQDEQDRLGDKTLWQCESCGCIFRTPNAIVIDGEQHKRPE